MTLPTIHRQQRRSTPGRIALLFALATLVTGCARSPLHDTTERSLRDSIIEATRRQLYEAEDTTRLVVTEAESVAEDLDIKPEFMPEIDRLSGPGSYQVVAPPLGLNLYGKPQRTVAITLEQAIRTAVDHNLTVRFARLDPAISEAQAISADAAFDWVLFSNLTASNTDSPRPSQSVGGTTFGVQADVRETVSYDLGLRKLLSSGGQVAFQQTLTTLDNRTPGLSTSPDPSSQVDLLMQFDQPLLRGFGSDVALAEVRITRNAHRESIQSLRGELLTLVTDVESAYWSLLQAHYDLKILNRLLERGIAVRERLRPRRRMDVTGAQWSDAVATVSSRETDVQVAQQTLRSASDQLKLLMNDPQFPVGSEILMLPADDAITEAVAYNFGQSLQTAFRYRPEIQQSVLAMDDTSIRLDVADNGRLPRLDLSLQAQWHALSDATSESYSDVLEGQYIDYIAALQFEYPIGNRAAEALYSQRLMERLQASLAYDNTVQQVTSEVQASLRTVETSFALIGQTTQSRIAAAENLRTLTVEQQANIGFTVESLDLEFRRQEALAQAERDEITARISYNNSLSRLYASMGTSLERNRIKFVVPDEDELVNP